MKDYGKRRPLSEFEHKIIDKMLGYDFEAKSTIERQLKEAYAKDMDSNDEYGSVTLGTEFTETAHVTQRVPIELESLDSDNVPIAALLHIVDGKINELEFYKADGSKIINMPDSQSFTKKVW